jgi:hypothetical protein
MEGVVVQVRVRAPCKRFAIKDNAICDRSARGFDGHNVKLTAFFLLRTMRVVTRTSANLSRVPSALPTNEREPISRVVSAIAMFRQPCCSRLTPMSAGWSRIRVCVHLFTEDKHALPHLSFPCTVYLRRHRPR